jgi:putative restriction endonuclease
MDRITELHLILDLIKKHNLPLSPILEYAIQEKAAEYSGSNPEEVIIEMKLQEDNSPKSLAEYVNDFATLSVAVSKGKKLPHKAILLLSIMQMIEDGDLANNMIPLDNRIAETFARTWYRYFNTKAPCVWTPFYHLKGEAFWHFKSQDSSDKLEMLLSFGGTPSIGKMRPVIKFAYFDEELYSLMDNAQTRNILRNILIENYLL